MLTTNKEYWSTYINIWPSRFQNITKIKEEYFIMIKGLIH